MARSAAKSGTDQRILDVAERLVQTRGFNAFSYADIADALEVTKASLHYHFPSKAELGKRLVERYEKNFLAALAAIDAEEADGCAKLNRYVKIYADVLRANRMCLCGMLAAEFPTLPKPMRDEIRHFFAVNEDWLESVLEEGRASGCLSFQGEAREVAQLLVGALEGAMMLARSCGEPRRFHHAAERLLNDLGV